MDRPGTTNLMRIGDYVLSIRQQPKHSRMCGFGEKVDRRPIDPPPIIELSVKDKNIACFKSLGPYYFMHASILGANSETELHLLKDGKTRSTAGSIVSSLYFLKDTTGTEGAFFIFPDLSVRMEGTYRLKYYRIDVDVYPAKKFPGMEESTALSKCFAEQGLKIRIRKEVRLKGGKAKEEEIPRTSKRLRDYDIDYRVKTDDPYSRQRPMESHQSYQHGAYVRLDNFTQRGSIELGVTRSTDPNYDSRVRPPPAAKEEPAAKRQASAGVRPPYPPYPYYPPPGAVPYDYYRPPPPGAGRPMMPYYPVPPYPRPPPSVHEKSDHPPSRLPKINSLDNKTPETEPLMHGESKEAVPYPYHYPPPPMPYYRPPYPYPPYGYSHYPPYYPPRPPPSDQRGPSDVPSNEKASG